MIFGLINQKKEKSRKQNPTFFVPFFRYHTFHKGSYYVIFAITS